jgi:hypothetical protein
MGQEKRFVGCFRSGRGRQQRLLPRLDKCVELHRQKAVGWHKRRRCGTYVPTRGRDIVQLKVELAGFQPFHPAETRDGATKRSRLTLAATHRFTDQLV